MNYFGLKKDYNPSRKLFQYKISSSYISHHEGLLHILSHNLLHDFLLNYLTFIIFQKIYCSTSQTLIQPYLKKKFSQIQRHGKTGVHFEHTVVRRFEVFDAGLTRYYLLSMSSKVEESCEGKSTYRKINKQMKFQFLNRVLGQGQSIFEAAQQIGIHYSTAKTIIFFHKHNHKSYRSFKLEDTAPVVAGLRAICVEKPDGIFETNRIEIVSNSHFQKWEPRKEVKAGNISLTYLRTNKAQPSKLHPLRNNSKKSSKSSSSNRVKREEWNELDSAWQESFSDGRSDSSYVCNK